MRLCLAKDRKAIFHCWEQVSEVIAPSRLRDGHLGGSIRYTAGIVEYEDGGVESVAPGDIVFLDTKKLLAKVEKEYNKWEARQSRDEDAENLAADRNE